MTDPKKSSNEGSILGRIVSSIEEIEKIDADNGSKEENNENKKFSEENKGSDEFPISSKADEFLADDSKRKVPFLPIIGSIVGVVLVLIGIFLMLGVSDRVVDSVASGETGTISIFVIFLGVIVLGLSILKFISRKESISEAFDSLHDLRLLDEYDEKNMNENKKDSNTNAKLINVDPDDYLEDNDLVVDTQNGLDFNINDDEYVENIDSSLSTDFSDTDFENINISEDPDFHEDIYNNNNNNNNFDEKKSEKSEDLEKNSKKDYKNDLKGKLEKDLEKDLEENLEDTSEDTSSNEDESSGNESSYEESFDNFIKDDDTHT